MPQPAAAAGRGRPPFRLSCTSFSFPLLRLPKVARLLELLEFRHIDLCIAEGDRDVKAQAVEADSEAVARADREACRAANLSVVDIFCHLGRGAFDHPLNTPDAAQRELNRGRFRAYVRYAAGVRAEGLTISPGKRWDGIADGGFDLACRELVLYAGWAGERGLRLSVEPHLDSIVADPGLAASLAAAVRGLTLTLDYSHFVARGIEQAAVHPLLPLAGHLHVRQAAPGRLQAAGDEGIIDFDAIVDRLAGLGYRGALTLEYLWSPWQDMNRVDVLTETLVLRRRLEARIATLAAGSGY